MATLGQVVRDVRNQKGILQEDIEKHTRGKLKQSWVAALETGRITNPPRDKLEFLAAALGTTVFDLYQRAGYVPAPTGLSTQEQRIIEMFRQLNPEMQTALLFYAHSLNQARQGKTIEDIIENENEAAA